MEEQCLIPDDSSSNSHGLTVRFASTQISSHHATTPRRRSEHLRHTIEIRHFLLILLFSCFISFTSATLLPLSIPEEMVESSLSTTTESLGSTFARLAHSGTIIVDQRPPPEPKLWNPNPTAEEAHTNEDLDLRRRNTNNSSSSSISSADTKTSSSSAAPSTLAPTTTTSSAIVAATTSAAASLPTPFDTGFNNNITASCNAFMTSMLSNATFKSCLPFSLLLQNSNSFFQASKSLVRITQTLDYSCSANITLCSTLLSSFASNITSQSACASDLSSQNPTIQSAHLGLLAYRPLYTASCLRNPQTSSYCFADAITNASSPSDSYIYFLPLNVSLVGGSQPTCSACLKDTMSVFESATGDRGLAIADTYASAAEQVNVLCGPGFVNQSLAAAVTTGGSSSVLAPGFGSMGMGMLLALWLSWLL